MIETAEEFKRLRESESPDEYQRAANEEVSTHAWHQIIESLPEMRFWAAQNKKVPIEILRILAEDEDPKVRSMVAEKRKIGKEIKDILVQDADSSVRGRLAWNSKLETSYLRTLSKDPEGFVREAALNQLNKRSQQGGAGQRR